MRRVRFTTYEKSKSGQYKLKVERGYFREFGVNYEEFESGAGNFSTAIIEKDDGFLVNIPVENVQFLDDIKKK